MSTVREAPFHYEIYKQLKGHSGLSSVAITYAHKGYWIRRSNKYYTWEVCEGISLLPVGEWVEPHTFKTTNGEVFTYIDETDLVNKAAASYVWPQQFNNYITNIPPSPPNVRSPLVYNSPTNGFALQNQGKWVPNVLAPAIKYTAKSIYSAAFALEVYNSVVQGILQGGISNIFFDNVKLEQRGGYWDIFVDTAKVGEWDHDDLEISNYDNTWYHEWVNVEQLERDATLGRFFTPGAQAGLPSVLDKLKPVQHICEAVNISILSYKPACKVCGRDMQLTKKGEWV